jgi:hypothetical protein
MSFPRHGEIYRSEGSARKLGPECRLPLVGLGPSQRAHREEHALAHLFDESPAGYSLAGWSPPEPASASPTVHEYAVQSVSRSRSFHRSVRCVLSVCVSPGDKRNLRSGYERFARHTRRSLRLDWRAKRCWKMLVEYLRKQQEVPNDVLVPIEVLPGYPIPTCRITPTAAHDEDIWPSFHPVFGL